MLTGSSLTNQSVASGAVDEITDQIEAQTSAILALSSTGGTLTADGTEQNLYYDNEPLGVFRPICLVLDLDAMQGGDTIEIKVYHRLSDAGALKQLSYTQYTGADGGLANGNTAAAISLTPNRHGYRITLNQTAGTNRDYPWELFLEV